MHRIRVDEDGALAQCCEFSMPLIHNQVQMETTAGRACRLNLIIERPDRECYIKAIVGLGLQPKCPNFFCEPILNM